MTTETHLKLEQVRVAQPCREAYRLKQLGNAVADLAQNHADILDSPDLKNSLSEFRQAYEESVARLANPNFTIATIGTTLVNQQSLMLLSGVKLPPSKQVK